MRKIMMFLIIFAFFTVNIDGQSSMIKEEKNLDSYFRDLDLDFDSKSLKGWIRIFNSDDKLDSYDIYVTKENKIIILEILMDRLNNKINTESRRIK